MSLADAMAYLTQAVQLDNSQNLANALERYRMGVAILRTCSDRDDPRVHAKIQEYTHRMDTISATFKVTNPSVPPSSSPSSSLARPTEQPSAIAPQPLP